MQMEILIAGFVLRSPFPFFSSSSYSSPTNPELLGAPLFSSLGLGIHCSTSSHEVTPSEKLPTRIDFSLTGGAYDFTNGTTSLTDELIASPKKVMILRHGLSTWNSESRIQAVDAKRIYPKEYTTWREDPANFVMNDR